MRGNHPGFANVLFHEDYGAEQYGPPAPIGEEPAIAAGS